MNWHKFRVRSTTVAGGGLFALTVQVLAMIFVKPELADNDLFKSLAQAIIIQGLIGLACAFYFTAKERPAEPPADPLPDQGEG